MRRAGFVLGLALMVAGTAVAPAGPPQVADRWFKGVTHIHSLWSDGDDAPEMIAAWYADRDYAFVAFSEHNTLQQGDRYIPIDPQGRLTPERVARIRDRFGEDWVETRVDDGLSQMRLKRHDELRARFDTPDRFVMIPAEEVTSGDGGPHMNAVNLRELIPGQQGASRVELIQGYIDAVEAQSQAHGVPMLAHVNHVNYADGVTIEELVQVRGLEFFEVYNGHHDVYNWGNPEKGMPPTEVHWDVVQSLRLLDDPNYVLYGVATDDSHHYFETGAGHANPGRGWVMVRASALDSTAIVAAMKRGDFYSSTGVTLTDVATTDQSLSLRIAPEAGVSYRTQFIGTRRGFVTDSAPAADSAGTVLPRGSRRYSDDIGVVLHESVDLAPTYRFTGDELYVRARVVSSKAQPNPFRAGDLEMAWTQPALVGR